MSAASKSSRSAALLLALYRNEERSGWSVGMRAITRSLIAQATLPDGPAAELGCGGGHVLAELGSLLPGRLLTGMDLHPQALSHAAQVTGDAAHLTQAHLHRLPWPDDAFALLLALDALDQRGVRLTLALREAWRVLAVDGVLLLRVSAGPWLLGPHDVAFNTGRRYTRRTLDQALRRTGFTPERVTYANSVLAAPIAALRLLQRWRLLPFAPSLYNTPGIDALLAAALRCEARWLERHDLPAGLSLYVAARKSARGPRTHDAIDEAPNG
jgi:SAM-dependent methyltransferase